MAIVNVINPSGAPTSAIVVAAPYAPGPVVVGTSSTQITIPDIDQLPRTFEFLIKEFNPAFQPGTRMRAAVPGTTDLWMEGTVTAFDPATNILDFTVTPDDGVSGSGTTHGGEDWEEWTLNISGIRGPPGIQGERGPKGETVYNGPSGPTGETGSAGPIGDMGPTGASGADGAAATISVGTTTSVPAGATAGVTNSGTQHAAILDFVIPGGGPAGPIGPTGPPGPLGAAAPPLVVTGNQVSLDIAAPLEIDGANNLNIDLSAYALLTALGAYAPLSGPVFTGVAARGVTPGATANNDSLVTAEWTQARLAELLARVVLPGYISGLTLANNATTPNTVLDIAVGGATSDDHSATMILAAPLSKNCNAAWAPGAGNGVLDSGATLAASTWYHVYLIQRADTGAVDVLISTSVSAPTLPTNYTKKRRIGSIRTNASAQIIAFTQQGDEFLFLQSIQDMAAVVGTTAAVLRTLTVPTGVKIYPIMSLGSAPGINSGRVYISSPDANDEIPGLSTWNFGSTTTQVWADFRSVRSNTSGQIRTRNTDNDAHLWIGTRGWIDSRGK